VDVLYAGCTARVYAVFQTKRFQFLDENALRSDLAKVFLLEFVAGGLHDHEFRFDSGDAPEGSLMLLACQRASALYLGPNRSGSRLLPIKVKKNRASAFRGFANLRRRSGIPRSRSAD